MHIHIHIYIYIYAYKQFIFTVMEPIITTVAPKVRDSLWHCGTQGWLSGHSVDHCEDGLWHHCWLNMLL